MKIKEILSKEIKAIMEKNKKIKWVMEKMKEICKWSKEIKLIMENKKIKWVMKKMKEICKQNKEIKAIINNVKIKRFKMESNSKKIKVTMIRKIQTFKIKRKQLNQQI